MNRDKGAYTAIKTYRRSVTDTVTDTHAMTQYSANITQYRQLNM